MMERRDSVERKEPFGPFGDIGTEIAETAAQLIECLSAEPEPITYDTAELPTSDKEALSTWIGMEWLIPIVDTPNKPLGGGTIRRRAHDAVVAFHVALPYNEAERQWLDRKSMSHASEMPSFIQGQEDRLMVAGVWRAVSGRELTRRWMLWRRGTDEFTGQDSVAEACKALGHIQDLMG